MEDDIKAIPIGDETPEIKPVEDLPIDNPPPKKKRAAPRKTPRTPKAPKKKGVTWPPVEASAPPKIKSKPTPTKPPALRAPLYRKIAAVFIGLTVCVVAFVLYLTLSRATIKVSLKSQTVSAELAVTVTSNPGAGKNEILGKAVEVTLERTETVPVQGEGKPVAEKAGGTVTIVNLAAKDQALVKTTRLLSEGGVLFRITANVVVPKGGRVTVRAEADQPGKQGEISAGKFTIPGLPASLQDKIYAVSTEAMTGGERVVKVLTQGDIDAAYKTVEDKLRATAEAKLREAVGEAFKSAEAVASLTVTKRTTDATAGKEASAVAATVAVKASGIFYMKDQLAGKLAAELAASVSGDRNLSATSATPTVTIERVDAATGVGIMNVKITGSARLKASSQVFDKDRLAGLSRSEAETYLNGFPDVESVEIFFRPPFIHSIPRLKDHIDITIE